MLHNQKESPWRFDDFIKLDYVRVSNDFQNVDLAADPLYIVDVRDLVLLQDLDGHLLVSKQVDPLFDFTKGPLTERLSYSIGPDHKPTRLWLLN